MRQHAGALTVAVALTLGVGAMFVIVNADDRARIFIGAQLLLADMGVPAAGILLVFVPIIGTQLRRRGKAG